METTEGRKRINDLLQKERETATEERMNRRKTDKERKSD